MKADWNKRRTSSGADSQHSQRGLRLAVHWVIIIAALLVVIVGFLLRRGKAEYEGIQRKQLSAAATSDAENAARASETPSRFNYDSRRTAEEIVAGKVVQFGKNRRAVVQRLSAHHGKEIPEEIERFFDAVEAGNWEETDRLWQTMAKRSAQYEGSTHDPKLDPFWPAVLETYGAAEQAHLWPAGQLLEYSEAILGSLRPGMVYVGGTDPGRFIPTLVNETSSGEQHVILTQNAFADARYQEYLRFLYGERITLPGQPDVDSLFAEYIADATRRLEHDEQFPTEPKQLRAREDVRKVNGKVQVSGADAVMDINERILLFIMEKNPELSFAMEESFPMKKTYDGAKPLGPIFELRADNPEGVAADPTGSLAYWREKSASLMGNSEASQSQEVLRTWSKMIVGHGNLMAHNGNGSGAEEAFRLALEIVPRNTDAIISLSEHLSQGGRTDAAQELVTDFGRRNPDLKADLDRILPQYK